MKYFSLEWHRACLKNMKDGLSDCERQVVLAQKTVDVVKEMVAFRERQIAEAERLGKTEFDPEKFLRPAPEG